MFSREQWRCHSITQRCKSLCLTLRNATDVVRIGNHESHEFYTAVTNSMCVPFHIFGHQLLPTICALWSQISWHLKRAKTLSISNSSLKSISPHAALVIWNFRRCGNWVPMLLIFRELVPEGQTHKSNFSSPGWIWIIHRREEVEKLCN